MVDSTIKISGDDAYKKEVERIVDRILLTRTGQAIAAKIRAHGVLIIQESDPDDAEALARETGQSRIALIKFYPNTKSNNMSRLTAMGGERIKAQTLRSFPGWGPDEVLFHEMVHAARMVGGDIDQVPLGGGYDDEEEYFGILVTNIYESEKGKPAQFLRKTHKMMSDLCQNRISIPVSSCIVRIRPITTA